MARFMLLIRGGVGDTVQRSPEDYQRILERYMAWSGKLRAEGRNLGGDELGDGGAGLRSRNGQVVVDGPFAEAKEAIGGYFLIEAADLNEATEIAKECPAVLGGGR